MSRTAAALASATLALLAGCSGDAGSDSAVRISDVWARTTPSGTSVGAVYLTATSERDDTLVGASVDTAVAATATLHATATDDSGATSMEALDSLGVPADGELVLEPAGNHVMLVDLAGPLEEGDTFELTLTFDVAGDETVSVEVRSDAP